MTNFLTGTNRGLGGLRVDDASTDVFGVNHIVFSSGATLTDNGNGKVSIAISGGGSGTVASATQYQVAYYTATGTAVGGNAGLTFDATDATVALTANSASAAGLVILNGGAGAPQLTIGDSTINDAGSIMDIVGNTHVRLRPGTTPTVGNDKTVSIELKDSAGALKEYITALTTTGQRELSINNDAADIDFRVETVAQANAFKIDAAGETATFNVPLTLSTDLAVADGGTGQSTAQAAIDALTQVSGATTGHILTKDGLGNATFQAASGGGGMTSFTAAGSLGANQTITNGNTLTIAAGDGITTTGSATDTITVESDMTATLAVTAPQFASTPDDSALALTPHGWVIVNITGHPPLYLPAWRGP
jgi:hypothetical protein